MMKLKGCPRCGGDLFEDRGFGADEAGYSCLQCGKSFYARTEPVTQPIKGSKRAPRLGGSSRIRAA